MKIKSGLLSIFLVLLSCQSNPPSSVNQKLLINPPKQDMNFNTNASSNGDPIPWGNVLLVPNGYGSLRCPDGSEVNLPGIPRQQCPNGYYETYDIYETSNCYGYERHGECVKYDNGNPDDDNNNENCKDKKLNTFSVKNLTAQQKNDFRYQKSLMFLFENLTAYKNSSYFVARTYLEVMALPNTGDNILVLNSLYESSRKNSNSLNNLKQQLEQTNKITGISSFSSNLGIRFSQMIPEIEQKNINFSNYSSYQDMLNQYNVINNAYSSFSEEIRNSVISLAKQKSKAEKLVLMKAYVNFLQDMSSSLVDTLIIYTNYTKRLRDYFEMTSPERDSIDIVRINNTLTNVSLDVQNRESDLNTIKQNLEIDGLINYNNTVSDPDTDLKPILDQVASNISKIENLFHRSSRYIDTLDTTSPLPSEEEMIEEINKATNDIESSSNTLKSTIEVEIAEEQQNEQEDDPQEDPECSKLRLKTDKKEFSPNGDNIDDTVNFTVVATKDKQWTLDINNAKPEASNTEDAYDQAINEYLNTSNESHNKQKKSFSGIGTGKPQNLIWDGKDDNNKIIDDGKYNLNLKVNSQEIKKSIKKIGDIKLLFDTKLAIETASEDVFSTESFSTKATFPIKDDSIFTIGNGDQAILGMETYWDKKYIISGSEFVKISGLFLLVGPDKLGKKTVIARYPQQAFELNINASNYADSSKNTFKYTTPWLGRNEIKGSLVYGKNGPFMTKNGMHEIIFRPTTIETNISNFKMDVNASTKLSKFQVINKFNKYGDNAPYYVNGDSQEGNLKNNIKYHIREAHDINFMNAKVFVSINAYLHNQSNYLTSLNNIVRTDPKENNPDKKGLCFNKSWSPEKIYEKVESVANMEYTYDTWTAGNPDLIQSYRYTGNKPSSYSITNYSTRNRHNIQVLFNKDSSDNLRIATAYPDIDAVMGDAIPLNKVREYYENMMNNGASSNSSSRNQVYQKALTEFKRSLLWANNNSMGTLTPLSKAIIIQYNSIASKDAKILVNPNKPSNKMPKIDLSKKLDSIFSIFDGVNY